MQVLSRLENYFSNPANDVFHILRNEDADTGCPQSAHLRDPETADSSGVAGFNAPFDDSKSIRFVAPVPLRGPTGAVVTPPQ